MQLDLPILRIAHYSALVRGFSILYYLYIFAEEIRGIS